MRAFPQISALVIAMALLPACSKPAEPGAELVAGAKQADQNPFQRNGELLSVNVNAMPRPAFIAKLTELTGVKITAEGDNNQTVTVHAVDASLRKVLSMAVADAPYSMTMQYTNLQDSFPASVVITRYHGQAATQPKEVRSPLQPHSVPTASLTTVEPVQGEEPDGPDFTTMQPEEQISYFLSQPKDEQSSLIFDMEPTAADAELMAQLIAKSEVSSEIKIEMLDSLSNGEYSSGAPAIKSALDATDPEVATKAVEVLTEMGSAKDIPALKALAEKTTDESVQTAVTDAIETLQQ